MNQYMLLIQQPDGEAPPPEVLEPIMRNVESLTQEMIAAGAWVGASGLRPASEARTVRPHGEGLLVTDGPFAEAKEHVGGYTLVRAPDMDGALEWARRTALATTLPVEVRQVQL